MKSKLIYILIFSFFQEVNAQDDWKTFYGLAKQLLIQEQYDKAKLNFEESKIALEEVMGKGTLFYASISFELAYTNEMLKQYESALLLYNESMEILQKLVDNRDEQYILASLGLARVYIRIGAYKKASTILKEIEILFKKGSSKEKIVYVNYLRTRAFLNANRGLFLLAEQNYNEALIVLNKLKLKNDHDRIEVLNDLAELNLVFEFYDKSNYYLNEAKRLIEKNVGIKPSLNSAISISLHKIYLKKRQFEQAEGELLATKSKLEVNNGNTNVGYIQISRSLGSLYAQLGLLDKAEFHYLESKALIEQVLGRYTVEYAEHCNQLGAIYLAKNQFQQAEILFKETINIFEAINQLKNNSYYNTLSNLAALYIQSSKYDKSDSVFGYLNVIIRDRMTIDFYKLPENDKINFYLPFQSMTHFYNNYVIMRYPQKHSISGEAYNHWMFMKAILFNSSKKSIEFYKQTEIDSLRELYLVWKEKKELLLKSYGMDITQRLNSRLFPKDLKDDLYETESKLMALYGESIKYSKKEHYTWQEVQKKLKNGEAAIEIIKLKVFERKWTDKIRYLAFLITPTSKFPELIVLENGNELEGKYYKYYQNAIKSKVDDENSYNQYWANISKQLVGIKKVYVSLDGIYNTINLNTLKNPKTGKYLLEEMEVQLVGNSKDLISIKNTEPVYNEAVLMGYPDYNNRKLKTLEQAEIENLILDLKTDTNQRFVKSENITELAGTKIEIENISNSFKKTNLKVKSYIEEQATEQNLRELGSHTILHIATHGFFLSDLKSNYSFDSDIMGIDNKTLTNNPLLRSGLLLANAKNALTKGMDGILTAYEAMDLNLDSTELVVLSACETGLGEIKNGEGVYGLQRAFQQAGAKTVLMSLWTVSDEATQLLMSLFYSNLIDKKYDKFLALKNAQLELKKTYTEPYYWGAFIMVGQ